MFMIMIYVMFMCHVHDGGLTFVLGQNQNPLTGSNGPMSPGRSLLWPHFLLHAPTLPRWPPLWHSVISSLLSPLCLCAWPVSDALQNPTCLKSLCHWGLNSSDIFSEVSLWLPVGVANSFSGKCRSYNWSWSKGWEVIPSHSLTMLYLLASSQWYWLLLFMQDCLSPPLT